MPDSSTDRSARRAPWSDPWRLTVGVALLLAVVAGSLTLLSVANAPRFSLLDESTHIDYAWRASRFEITHTGQPFSDYTVEQWSCRGQFQVPLPPCGSDTPANEYPNRGEQYNAFHPPGYYVVTGISARALAAVSGVDFVTAARALGAVWLWAAMFGLYLTMRYWRCRVRYATAAALLISLVPAVLHASSVVTNDAPAALSGVAALFVLGRVMVHRNEGWILPLALAAAAASTKVLNSLGLLVVAAVFLLVAVHRVRRNGWKPTVPLLRIVFGMVVAVMVIHLGWGFVQDARAVADYTSPIEGISNRPIHGLPFDEWLPTIVGGTSLANNYYLDPEVSSSYLTAWATVLNLLLGVGPFMALAVFRKGTPRWLAGGTVLLGAATFPLLVQVMVVQGSYSYFANVPARYGMSLVPVAAAVLAMVAERKRLDRLSLAVVGVGLVVMVASVSGIAS